jgi:hypothetical protein
MGERAERIFALVPDATHTLFNDFHPAYRFHLQIMVYCNVGSGSGAGNVIW